MPRILVVDDEPHIREVICFAIERAGMTSVVARNGAEAMKAFRRGNLDLAILDIGMPEMDGLEVCRRIRTESSLPILFLSARDDEIDKVVGLEIGGDDYVTKPFSPRELVARVKAILKRASGMACEQQASLARGPLRLDRDSRYVAYGEVDVALTAVEFAILAIILARPNAVFTREQLMGAAYGAGIHVADRTIDSHIRNIRAKFSAAGCASVITTVHGVGFKLAPALGA